MSVQNSSYSPRLVAKGSLIVHTGTSTSEVLVGTNNQILSAQSTAASGVSWITNNNATAVNSIGFVLISSTTATAAIDGVTFSSIPQTYKNLMLNVVGRQNGGENPAIRIWINSDSTSSYTVSNNSYAGAYSSSGGGNGASLVNVGTVNYATTGDSNTASHIGSSRIYIPNYTGTSGYKTLSFSNFGQNISTNRVRWAFGNVTWRSTAAVDKIELFAASTRQFNSGTIISLYGTN